MKKFMTAVATVALLAQGGIALSGTSVMADGHKMAHGHFDAAKLDKVLAAQDDAHKARYQYRHPKETLKYFGVAPGMTVVDTLAGSYYSPILIPYLGNEGALYGVSYSIPMREIDNKDNAERMESYRTWPARYTKDAEGWRGTGKTAVGGFLFGDVPAALKGKVDVFLMMRAMHHLNKYEDVAMTRTKALKDVFEALKPGGTLGIVQHRAPAGNSDDWAKGFNGYIKQEPLIAAVKAAGFEFVGSSEINANPKDMPTEADFVWRLPPVFAGSKDNPEKKAMMAAIGESDRMTLKFRKPE